MDIVKLNFTVLEQRVFEFLTVSAGKKLSQREISCFLDVSPTAIANSLKKLKKLNFIKLEKMKNINLISFNRDEQIAIELKRVYNLKNIYLAGLSSHLEEVFAGGTIILFGSYSFGEDVIESDIDIAIIGRKDKEVKLGKFEKYLGRKIRINTYSCWGEINKQLKNNILNGILLSGGVEL